MSASRREGFPFEALLFIGLLLLNSFLVSPFIGWYDSGELIGTTVCLGISHPSGQVLFHLLGKIFLLLPWETPAYRLGLMSATCSALASVLFFRLSRQLALAVAPPDEIHKTLSPVLNFWLFLLTLAWSLSMPWWRYSLMPLVYALHLLLGLLLLWALSLEKPGKWVLCFFILGAATVFRPTQFFAIPFVGFAFLWESRKRPKELFKPLIFIWMAFILGRSTGLYLPLRSALHPEIAYADITHLGAFLRHVFALKFSNYVGAVSNATILAVLRQMAFHFWTDLTPLGVGLLLWGAVVVWWKKDKVPLFLWIGLAWGFLEALFVFTIPFPTFESHQVLLSWVYLGFLAGLPLVFTEQISRKGQYRITRIAVGIALSVFVFLQLTLIGHQFERQKERGAEDYAHNLLRMMEPNALYVPTEENEYFPVAGYQQSFQFKKSIQLLEPGTPPLQVAPRIQKCLRENRPLYVTRQWALPPGWVFEPLGPLWKVVTPSPEIFTKTPAFLKPEALWGGISLLGCTLSPARVKAGGMLAVTYLWTRKGPNPCDASDGVVALFADSQENYWMKNGVFWLHDIHDPPLGSFNRLKAGLTYEEKRILFIPSDYPPGRYQLVVGLQKQVPRQEGREAFEREFYERNAYQDLDKFLGREVGGAVVHFSAQDSGDVLKGLWPVTKSSTVLMDPRFAPVAEVEIESPDAP